MIAGVQLPVPTRDPTIARDAAERVLRSSDFRTPDHSFVERAGDFVADVFGRVLQSLWGSSNGIAVAVIAALIVAAIVLTRRYLRSASPDLTSTPVLGKARARQRTSADWLREAEDHERSQSWRMAIRCRYRALIAGLGARGVVAEQPGRTAGEYRAEVDANAPSMSGAFQAATQTFELAWYGHDDPDAADAAKFRQQAESVVGAL